MIYFTLKEDKVDSIHLNPFDPIKGLRKTEEELLAEGFLVPSIPEALSIPGKSAVLYYDVEANEFYYEYIDEVIDPEELLAEIKERTQSAEERYASLDKETEFIEVLKGAKIEALKEKCTQTIHEGFLSGANEYGFNDLDQSNFTQRMLTIVAGSPGPFKWKTLNNGVVELTASEFQQVVLDAEAHKLAQQEKYWGLEQEVLAANTNTEVDVVAW